jgi:hypothetical protein
MASKLFLSIMLLFVLASSAPISLVGASSGMWSKTYGNGTAHSLVETSDGGFAIAGVTGSFGAGGNDFWLVKTDANGNMEWNHTYGEGMAHSLVETSDGGYAVAGGNLLVKTDKYGNMEWNQTFEGASICSLVMTSDGGYALAGVTSYYSEEGDFWLVKTDAQGNIEWYRTYGGDGSETAYSLVETSDGGYALAGVASGAIGTEAYIDSWMVKTDANGNELWSQTYGGTGDQYIYSLVETSDDAFALAGWKTSTYAGPPYFWLIKTDEYGNIPEFPSWIFLSLFLTATFVGVTVKKRLSQSVT